ncbi:MAG: restriction endonuclease, partial [Chloroflexi bacterium]|nr:restriction endonuclease [Chloroflexota bacterium]
MRVLDPACGSGHFLLAAARRLAKELAKIRTGDEEPAPERVREAVRDVVAHCVYGVDKNPLAVELCRVALWLEAHCAGKPLTFLDHRIRCGDSLLGVFDLEVLKRGIPDEAFAPVSGDDRRLATSLTRRNREERQGQRTLFSGLDPAEEVVRLGIESLDLDAIPDDTPEAVRKKKQRYDELQRKAEHDRRACDLWTAAFFQPRNGATPQTAFITTDTLRRHLERTSPHPQALAQAVALAHTHRFFHWPIEFPEVFADAGFDVVLGNPPFMGGLKISGALGDKYRHWLEVAYAGYGGTADLCAVLFRRAFALLKPGGRMGMVATNTIGQGDTRESGLAVILRQGGAITFAKRFIKWPGAANVEVNLVAIRKGAASGEQGAVSPVLDGQPVDFISSRLDSEPEAEPKRLRQNEGKAFQGDIVRGIGFVLEPEEAESLLAKDPRNADCLFPYLNGEDLNSHPEQKPSRWVICFHDWGLERAKQYPDLLRIVEERVKPERERLRGPGDKRNREYWWQFGAYRAGMRGAIAPLRRVLVRSRVSELHAVVFVPKGYVYGDATVVFAFDDDYHFALLQS